MLLLAAVSMGVSFELVALGQYTIRKTKFYHASPHARFRGKECLQHPYSWPVSKVRECGRKLFYHGHDRNGDDWRSSATMGHSRR